MSRRFAIFGRGSAEEHAKPEAGSASAAEPAAPAATAVPAAEEWLVPGHEAAERERVAAETAAHAAEERALDEILALEDDLEQAKRWGVERLVEVERRLAEAERRAADAERRAADAERRLERTSDETEPELAPPEWVLEAPVPEDAAAPDAGAEQVEPDPAPAAEAEAEPDLAAAAEFAPPEPVSEPEPRPDGAAPPGDGGPDFLVSLSNADFDELRGLGMSATQAKRVIRYRNERDGFASVDELDDVPGFPRPFLAQVKNRVVP